MRWSHFVISKGEHSALQIRNLVAVICRRLKPLIKVLDLSTNHDRVDYYVLIYNDMGSRVVKKGEKQCQISGLDFFHYFLHYYVLHSVEITLFSLTLLFPQPKYLLNNKS